MPNEGSSYRISDDLNSFKINVRFSSITSESGENSILSDSYIFQWQEKRFSHMEINNFVDLNNCSNELERLYHRKLNHLNIKPCNKKCVLFSLVDEDPEILKFMDCHFQTDLAHSFIAKKQRNKLFQLPNYIACSPKHPIIYEPSKKHKVASHYPSKDSKKMCILVDLCHNIKNDGDIEKMQWETLLLCKIEVDNQGFLHIMPDFTSRDKTHRIQSHIGDYMFEYTLVHASDDISKICQAQGESVLSDFNIRKLTKLINAVGIYFEQPEENLLRIMLRGEIICAEDFEYGSLYVQYFLELPSGWKSFKSEFLTGSTQVATLIERNKKQVSHFSFPLEFDYGFLDEDYFKINADDKIKWPTLFMEIFSIDCFTRSRTEGYAYIELPKTPGIHVVKVNAWRPVGQSVVSELRRFFVGGTPQLDDVTYTKIPSDFESLRLSKYGFRTQGTGSILLRFHGIWQCAKFLEKQKPSQFCQDLAKHISLIPNRIDVFTAIKLYQEARKKLLQARRGIQSHIIADN